MEGRRGGGHKGESRGSRVREEARGSTSWDLDTGVAGAGLEEELPLGQVQGPQPP